MNSPRRLLPAKQSNASRKRRNKRQRHSQSRPDHQGEKNKDHEKVSKPLKQIIRPNIVRTSRSKAQPANNLAPEHPPRKLAPPRQQIPSQIPGEQTGDNKQ